MITTIGSVVAFVRRRGRVSVLPASSIVVPRSQLLLYGLAVTIVTCAAVLAYVQAKNDSTSNVVQLWMLPGDKSDQSVIHIGLQQVGGVKTTYRLQMRQNESILREWPELHLTSDETWETAFSLPLDGAGNSPIEAVLYRSERPDVAFRRVAVWLSQEQ